MGTRNTKRWFSLQTMLAALALGSLAAACGDDDSDPVPGGPIITLDGSVGIDATVPGSGGPDAGSDAGTTPIDPGTGDCKGANGCYSCKPAQSVQFLNACSSTSAACRPFDNTARLPGFTGTLPPLQ